MKRYGLLRVSIIIRNQFVIKEVWGRDGIFYQLKPAVGDIREFNFQGNEKQKLFIKNYKPQYILLTAQNIPPGYYTPTSSLVRLSVKYSLVSILLGIMSSTTASSKTDKITEFNYIYNVVYSAPRPVQLFQILNWQFKCKAV